MWQGKRLARTCAAEDVSTIPTVVLSVCEGELLPTSHAHIAVGPLGRGGGIEHAAGNLLLRRKAEAFVLECPVRLGHVCEAVPTLCGRGPVLDQLEDLCLDVVVGLDVAARLQDAGEIVDEFPAGDLGDEMCAAVFDAGVSEVQGGELDVWVLVAYAAFEAPHGLLGLGCLAADDIADLEIERDVL